MREPIIVATVLIFSFSALSSGQRPCAKRRFDQDAYVCVCNSSYCDDVINVNVVPNSGRGVTIVTGMNYTGFSQGTTSAHPSVPADATVIYINDILEYQTIAGFGGALTDAVGLNLNSLPADLADSIIKQYYSPSEGLNYKFARIPMGSSDFSTISYSYDEHDQDFSLTQFNLTSEDTTLKVPYIKKAFNYSGNSLNIIASPWSAPAWMKQTGSMKGGGPLKGDLGGSYYQTWANYFKSFANYFYRYYNLQIWAFTIQNEPNTGIDVDFPSEAMFWNATMQRDFVKNMLGPAVRQISYSPSPLLIMLDDDEQYLPNWADSVLSDHNAAHYINGIGVHWYSTKSVTESNLVYVNDKYPTKWVLYTQGSFSRNDTQPRPLLGSWARAQLLADNIISAFQNYAVGWIDFNLALDMDGGPNWSKNYADSPIIVNAAASEYYKQPMWYAIGLFSRYIQPGATKMKSSITFGLDGLTFVAFLNLDGTRITIISNKSQSNTYHLAITDLSRPGKGYYLLYVYPQTVTTVII